MSPHAQQPGANRALSTRTPQSVNGTFTPNSLHFVISHAGDPDIDPDKHRLVIHGLVKQPLVFTLDALARYPMVSRMAFVECGGNSAPLFSLELIQASVQSLHGLVSCAEWTGLPLSTLLDEAGIDPKAKWMVAEGGDPPHVSRSVPLAKAMDDAMIVLYQNGERIMPGNGHPLRLLLPGWEGNMNTKWVRRIQVTDQPGMTFYEPDRRRSAGRKGVSVFFLQEVKSFITHPSPGLALKGPGFYEISGVAYSATAVSQKSGCPPTAARAGRRRHCSSRSSARRSLDSARRGAGTAAPRYCKAGRGTSRATSSRPEPNWWPRVAKLRKFRR
jgi:sulfane dehydrogenase subunit SoxC